jgi:hypothetical protein
VAMDVNVVVALFVFVFVGFLDIYLLQVLLSRYFLSLDVLIMLLLNSIQMFTFKIFLKSKREKALIFVGNRIRYKKQRERDKEQLEFEINY